MPLTKRGECTVKQFAFARRIFNGDGRNKKQIALDVGYTPGIASKTLEKIENTVGFNAAMTKLAVDSNNLALAAIHEFKRRGFENFTNRDLNGALNAIGNAWSKFTEGHRILENRMREKESKGNNLRTIVMQHIEQQTLNNGNVYEQVPQNTSQSSQQDQNNQQNNQQASQEEDIEKYEELVINNENDEAMDIIKQAVNEVLEEREAQSYKEQQTQDDSNDGTDGVYNEGGIYGDENECDDTVEESECCNTDDDRTEKGSKNKDE